MGYRVKLQKVERPTNRSYYLNVPVPLAEALNLKKGEEFEWMIEDRNTLVLRRVKPSGSVRKKSAKPSRSKS
jgi:bifunctional DNA-binding transcriptional regulator/antitoxin component of YhaV-PrlF toxin-antitoxin module